MEEKVLIKSERYDVNKVFKVMVIIGLVLFVFVSIIRISGASNYYNQNFGADHEHSKYCYDYYWDRDHFGYVYDESTLQCEQSIYGNAFLYALSEYFSNYLWECLIPVAVFALIGGLIYLWLRSYELTVTDKRIYGKVAWGKRVDLPADSISSTATIRLLRGVAVATSSGKISFLVIKNADEVYGVINNLLIERQKEKAKESAPVTITQSDEADQLKKYKALLDSGVITQEEFDAKKKQLLGL